MWKNRGNTEKSEMGEKTDKDIKRLKTIVGKVPEDVKIKLDQMIQNFIAHPELPDITFPSLLSNIERAYVHFQSTRHGLQSFSTGAGSDRRLTLRRAVESSSIESKLIALSSESSEGISSLLTAFPHTVYGLNNNVTSPRLRAAAALESVKGGYASRLNIGPKPKVPKERRTDSYLNYRRQLPIWKHKEHILSTIKDHRVTFIKGDTGCGKTTQVAQFILEDATKTSSNVRIICTVPRRIAAVSVSERVSVERGERLGQTVGYQIRLESCISPCETLLTYCTSGVLLRSLSAPDYNILNKTTHIILDEVHERDRQTDFLLACLRDILSMFPHLRLILMGADLNNEMFSTYFGGECECPTIQVEGRLYPVEVFYLEDVLEMLNYENNDMVFTRRQGEQTEIYSRLVQDFQTVRVADSKCSNGCSTNQQQKTSSISHEVDKMIQEVWTLGDEAMLAEFITMLDCNEVNVNYQHSQVEVTMLMAAVVRGRLDYVQTLLLYGADLDIKSKIDDTEFSAIDWASDHRQHEILKFLLEHQYQTNLMPSVQATAVNSVKYQRLTSYLKSIDEERVDLMLVLRLLHQLHINSPQTYAVLIFLPGYDEIVTLKHLILSDVQLGFRQGTFVVFMLHSNIQTGDQRAAFEKPPRGMRKIILSTNIAESSLTIDDVVYVIDSGKAKEKSFDSLTSVTQLKSVWISKASVNQRRGRAGRCRPGICYHLFSTARYESMSEFPIPEIVRTSLQELCLHARYFMKAEIKIEQFFMRIPEPPAPIAVKKSVELLTVMGALDDNEQLTKLGINLLDFPLEPFLGKALIYAIVFKCLDPILTLVSVISYRDPFQLPSDPRDKQRAQECKAQFARDSFSDHMAYLKAFQDWEKSKLFCEGTERKFCRENYLSAMTFEMVYAIRSQLLGQLRASGFVKGKGRDIKELNMNSDNWALVKGVLVATLYPNICGVNHTKKTLFNSFNSKIAFHPSTTVTKKKTGIPEIGTDWIIFDEMTQQGPTNLVKGCTCVSTAAVALFAGSFNISSTNDEDFLAKRFEDSTSFLFSTCNLKINQWITLSGEKNTICMLIFLRKKVNDLVLNRLKSPGAQCTPEETATIQTIAAMLVSEDKLMGFNNIDGIGQWPKFVSGNLMSAPRTGFVRETATDNDRK